jgi:hypothetical protein
VKEHQDTTRCCRYNRNFIVEHCDNVKLKYKIISNRMFVFVPSACPNDGRIEKRYEFSTQNNIFFCFS